MQLRTESSPVLTGAQAVEHPEVPLETVRLKADTGFSQGGIQQSRVITNALTESLFGQVKQPSPVSPVPGIDDALLNKSVINTLKLTRTVGAVAEVRAAPIEVWEGEVKSVDATAQTMHVYLHSKLSQAPAHAGEIALEWVSDQDKDLVIPGAVFYWTLYKETRRGSIRNSQELRFRRLPSWSRSQLERIQAEASKLLRAPRPARVFEESSR